MSTQIAELKKEVLTRADKARTIEDLIKAKVGELGKALPAHLNAERLIRIALTTLRQNPELADCTPESFLGALFQSAQLGLEPNIDGQAYFLPFNNSKKINNQWIKRKEVQFIIGYKGYETLYYRHEQACTIDMHTVYEKDFFDYEYGTNSFIRHKPYDEGDDRGKPIKYYAIAKLKNGGSLFKVMSKSACIEHAKQHSKAYVTTEYDEKEKKYVKVKNPYFNQNSSWATDENAMCKKTVLIQLMKVLPKSVEIQKALAMDNTTKSTVRLDMFDVKDETNWDDKDIIEVERITDE